MFIYKLINKVKIYVIFIFLIFTVLFWFNSIIVKASNSSDDSKKVEELNKMASDNIYIDPNKTLELSTDAQKLAEKIGDDKGIVEALRYSGLAYIQLGNIEQAQLKIQKSGQLSEKIGYIKGLGNAENQLGTIYFEQGLYDQAMVHFTKALNIRTSINDKIGTSKVTNNIGRVNDKLGNYNKAIELFKESLALKGNEDLSGKANTLNNLGLAYRAKGDFNWALNNFNEALNLSDKIQFLQGKGYSMMNLGETYNMMGNLSQAEKYALDATEIYKKINYNEGLVYGLYHTGLIYFNMKQFEKAMKYYKLSESLALQIKQNSLLKDIYLGEAKVFETKGEHQEALEFYKKHMEIYEKNLNSDMQKKILVLQNQYEMKSKENEIKLLEKISASKSEKINYQRLLLITIFVFLVIYVVITIYLFKQIKQRKKKEKMNEQLININKMKDEFLINTSHELQTPLNGIINISETLAEGKYGEVNKKQKEELRVILSVARRLSLLIKDIIDIEKIKRNELKLNLTPIDIKSALVVVVDVFKHLTEDKNVEILVNIPEKLSPVLADENRLMQILFNLMGNGVKFTAKGTVTLSARDEGDFIKVIIEDTGIGISEEKQEKLFQAFTQAEDELSVQYGGSGLGLYISRQLLNRMNGQIFLEWSKPQKGTCFSFLLPKTKEEPVNRKPLFQLISEEIFVDTIAENKAPKNFKILAVDDEPTNLRVLKSIFNDEEHEVLTVSNGIEAIEIIKTQKGIDLVLMDVMMPKISGYEACRKIREKYSSYDLPVVILTARDTPEDIIASFDVGANDFVTKPFVAKELRARVSNLIQMKKSVQKALKNEMAFLQSQIKPHFLYNAISTIMSFCYTDGARAGELLAYLSQYLQKSFNIDNTDTTISLENELELTKAYTAIEKARFGERLTVEYDIDDSLMEQRILPLIIQPLVENSIRHGLMKRKNGGIVKIFVKREAGGISISVEDNGVGVKCIETVLKQKHSPLKKSLGGVGLSNVSGRLLRYYGTELNIYSKIDEGTRVEFIIPMGDTI